MEVRGEPQIPPKKGRALLDKLPPVGILIFLLAVGLGIGALSISAPWTSRPVAYEDTIPCSATLERVEGDYKYRRKRGWDLDEIYLSFTDHDRLYISSKVATKTLLRKLKAYHAGTVVDMRLAPDGDSVLALSVDDAEVLSYEAACRAIRFDNALGFLLGLFGLFMAGYAIWELCMTWKYRRLI